MNNDFFGVQSVGVKCPIVKEGDDIVKVVTDAVISATSENENNQGFGLKDGDIIGITESVVARTFGMYVTVDEIAEDIRKKFGNDSTVALIEPIYSRNRFSTILKGIARACKKVAICMPLFDEVGNPCGYNNFTGVNIEKYYHDVCADEDCEIDIINDIRSNILDGEICQRGFDNIGYHIDGYIDCRLHMGRRSSLLCVSWHKFSPLYTLYEICSDKNPDFGLLGTNASTDEKLKLFPTVAISTSVCEQIKSRIKSKAGVDVKVCCFGDGCFKDPVGGIWEFADPVTMVGFTDYDYFKSTPNEIKIKAFADNKFKDIPSGNDLDREMKNTIKGKRKSLLGSIESQGTTPRLRMDLIASLMDLTVGSGDRGTPVVIVRNYDKTYAD